jgi:hypothetical protein
MGRTVRFALAEWQIAAQHPDAGLGEGGRDSLKKRSSGVAAGAVREDETVASAVGRAVQKSADVRRGVGD